MRVAHVRFELPPLGLMVPPGGPARCFCCGARLARVVAPAKERRGALPPRTPVVAREACRRRNPPRTLSAILRVLDVSKSFHQGGRRSDPAVCFAATGRTRGTCLLCAGVAPSCCSATCRGLRGRRLSPERASQPRRATPGPAQSARYGSSRHRRLSVLCPTAFSEEDAFQFFRILT